MDKMYKVMEYIWAFAVGGALCVIAQILIDKTKLTPARILVTYVVAGVILTGVGLYGKLVDFCRCGGDGSADRIWVFACERSQEGDRRTRTCRRADRRTHGDFRRNRGGDLVRVAGFGLLQGTAQRVRRY